MTAALGVQIAAVFTWLGMVLAISFLGGVCCTNR